MKNNYSYILEEMDCFVPRNDAFSRVSTNPRKSVIARRHDEATQKTYR